MNRNNLLKSLAAGLVALAAAAALPASAQDTFQRRVVVEEFTGAWCGNCPRGIVGMQRLAEDFGDRFIGIAVHTGSGEPMVIPTYPDVQTDVIPGSGAPSCIINRARFKFDPYSGSGQRGAFHYGIDIDVAAAMAEPTEGQVELVAQWDDENQRNVRFTATTTFSIDSQTAPYALAFVLLEDGLTGTATNWQQVNYFSLNYNPSAGVNYKDDDMQQWRESPYEVSGVVYNHVPVNTSGIRTGIANSITAPITAYEPQVYTGTVSTLATHARNLIQDKSRLEAVCLLLNTTTGEVVNAAKAQVLGFGQSGITAQQHDATGSTQQFDLQGHRQTSATRKGIYVKQGRKVIK